MMKSDGKKLKCVQVFEGKEEKKGLEEARRNIAHLQEMLEEKQQSPNERASRDSQVSS